MLKSFPTYTAPQSLAVSLSALCRVQSRVLFSLPLLPMQAHCIGRQRKELEAASNRQTWADGRGDVSITSSREATPQGQLPAGLLSPRAQASFEQQGTLQSDHPGPRGDPLHWQHSYGVDFRDRSMCVCQTCNMIASTLHLLLYVCCICGCTAAGSCKLQCSPALNPVRDGRMSNAGSGKHTASFLE